MNSVNPKIIIGVGDMLGCGYYRCRLPYKALSKRGFTVELVNVLHPEVTKRYDVLMLQRQHSPGVFSNIEKFKENKPEGKVVFEFDDNLHAIPASNPSYQTYRNGIETTRTMEKMLELSDLVTVSTATLAREYSRFNKNIHVCMNAIDPLAIEEAEKETEKLPRKSRIRIGWAGSSTHLTDFQKVVKPLTKILQKNRDVNFVFIGHDMRSLFPADVSKQLEHAGDTFPKERSGEVVNFSATYDPTVAYYKLLRKADLDVAIAPIESFLFNKCKSYIKILEYNLAQIPFVASRYGPYLEYVTEAKEKGHNPGFLADSDKDWENSIQKLIDNENLRNELKTNNYNYLKNNHLVEHKIESWIKAYASIGIFPGSKEGTYIENIDDIHRFNARHNLSNDKIKSAIYVRQTL